MYVHRHSRRGGSCGRTHRALLVALAVLSLLASPVAAQMGEGIGLGVAPTAERIYWHRDLALVDSWYYGGGATLSFGEYVALQGYYLQGDNVEHSQFGKLERARRYGGDVAFTFADRRLMPFLRLGAGISDFELPDGGTAAELLTATGAAGIRLRLFERIHTHVFAQDVLFRASSSSPLVEPGAIENGKTKTFHNLSIGAGVDFRLGGEARQPETDRAFTGGLHGVTSPLELVGGVVRWDNAMGIEDLPMAGVRLGFDFGPWVGVQGYYFGSVENDLSDFTSYMGYGAEGRFNLSRSDAALTPYLVLGGGRVHFPDSVAASAGFDQDRKWNAILGGGVGVNLTERIRLDVAARDFLLTRSDPEATTAPDQLYHSWMYTGGIRISLGGRAGTAKRPIAAETPERPAMAAVSPADTTTAESDLVGQVKALRMEVDDLRREIRREEAMPRRPAATVDTAAAPATGPSPPVMEAGADTVPSPAAKGQMIQLPVLENGVIYIRFGETAAVTDPQIGPTGARRGADSLVDARLQALTRLLDEERARLAALEAAPAGAAVERTDSILALLTRLQAEVGPRAPARTPELPGEVGADRMQLLESRILDRLETLERQVRDIGRTERTEPSTQRTEPSTERAEPPAVRVEVAPQAQGAAVMQSRRPLGVLQGGPIGVQRIAPQVGATLNDPNQLLLGVKTDIGSAFGGPIRVVPELTFGVTDPFTWSLNGHLEYPIPVRVRGVRPWLGAGLGVVQRGRLELLFPNVLAGVTYPVSRYRLFGTLEGLDLFDDTRLMVGVSTPAPSFRRAAEAPTPRPEGVAEDTVHRRVQPSESSGPAAGRGRACARTRPRGAGGAAGRGSPDRGTAGAGGRCGADGGSGRSGTPS